MLEAFAGRAALERRVRRPRSTRGYLWHEFGDSHLILRGATSDDRDHRLGRRSPRLPAGRRAVLYAVRRRGEATAEQVAEQLDMTVSGARQHLTALARRRARRGDRAAVATGPSAAGARSRTRRPTRPTRYFPKAYGELTNELLGYVADTDRELLDTLFAKRRERAHRQRADAARGEAHARAKVAELTRILDEDGYLATCEQVEPGVFRIVEHNCAIWAVAAALRPGVHQRARVHPHRAAGRRRRARAAHGRRRPPLRLRGARALTSGSNPDA